MNPSSVETATRCMTAAYEGTMAFPTIVHTLREAGFEGYTVDYRRHSATYFLPDSTHVELTIPAHGAVAATFDAAEVERAVRAAQSNAPGYTYQGFCERVIAAGCAGYQVSFLGKRVLYFGRTAECHVELFPQPKA